MRLSVERAFFVCLILLAAPRAALADEFVLKYFVEVQVPSIDRTSQLSAEGYDVSGIDRENSIVGLVVTTEELTRLRSKGWPVTIRGSNARDRAIDALSNYTDPQEMSVFLDNMVAAYPDLVTKITLQNTLFEGQKQYALHITKDVGVPNERPSFILDAQHHAREVMTPEIAKDMIDYLTSRYATDAQVRRWVDNVNIYVVPIVNPDGAMYVFTTDAGWRKNRHPGCAVDDNRNYPALWGTCDGSSASCTDDTTRGGAPGSEPETQGIMQLTSEVLPFFTLSYHTFSELIMYPYGCSDPDEAAAFDEIGLGLNAILVNDAGVTGHYGVGPVWSTIYLADGIAIDTQYKLFGAYAFTIEANSAAEGFQPDYATWRNITVQRQRTAWKYFLDKTLDGAQIRGTVTDASTGLPLPANLDLQEVTFTHGESQRHADSKGHYHLLVHSNGTYHVEYSYPGYCAMTEEVIVGAGPATMNVALALPPGVPQGVNAASGGDNAIDLSWQAVAGADQYDVLRARYASGPYTLVATVPGAQTSYHDAPVSADVTYFYVVRSAQGDEPCESGDSAAVQAATTGACTVGPTFSGGTSVTNLASSTCSLSLFWPPAAASCGGSVTYRVYRSTTSPFTPDPQSLLASGLTGTSFVDHAALSKDTTYFYIVQAVDAANGVGDGNAAIVSGSPTGPDVLGTWTDDAGDTGTAKLTGDSPWSVYPTGGNAGPRVYATGPDTNFVCAALTSPIIPLQTGATLYFASKYDTETYYDAGIVEVATEPSFNNWTKVVVNYPNLVAYPGNRCGLPYDGYNAAFSHDNPTPSYSASPYHGKLSGYSGLSVMLRWLYSSDAYLNYTGWWVDDISITNAIVPGACAAGAALNPKEASPDGAMQASKASGSSVDLVYTPACGTLDNAVYWGTGPIAGAVAWTSSACALGNTGRSTFDPLDPAPGTFLYFVIVGQNAAKEGSYGVGASGERAEAVGVGACDKPQDLAGACP